MSVNQILEKSFSHFTNRLTQTALGQQQVMAVIPGEYKAECQVLLVDEDQIVVGVSSQAALYWLRMQQDLLGMQLSQQLSREVSLVFKCSVRI